MLPRASYLRRLRFEPLESRRLFSITVDTLVDENNGVGAGAGTSLREAIAAAATGDTIDFSVTGTINLSKELAFGKSLTINGPGANLLTIKPSNSHLLTRIFNIGSSGPTLNDVTISGLTLTGGNSAFEGGAISTRANLVVADCTISGNTASTAGGAIFSLGGPANSLTIRRCTISGNASKSEGGAIRKIEGTLLIEDSTIRNNTATSAGGGISAADGGISVTIRGSTLSQNVSQYYGGAVFVKNGNTIV